MKKYIIFVGASAILFAGALSSSAALFGNSNISDILANAQSDKVQGLSVTAGEGSAILIWNSKQDKNGVEAERYLVEYGTKSVAQGMALQYELEQKTLDKIPSERLTKLQPDVEYFFRVTPIFANNVLGKASEEVSTKILGSGLTSVSTPPIVVSAESVSNTSVQVTFSKEIILPSTNAAAAFVATNTLNELDTLDILGASYAGAGKTLLVLATAPQTEGVEYRVTASAQITDIDGTPIASGSTDSALFTGLGASNTHAAPSANPFVPAEGNPKPVTWELPSNAADLIPLPDTQTNPEKDTTPPEDITNLLSEYTAQITNFLVRIKWTASINTANDLSDQLLYRSENAGKVWETGKSLGDTATETTATEKPLTNITYKITTKDVAGNESIGAITTISLPALPKTGNGGFLFLAGASLFGIAVRRLRK